MSLYEKWEKNRQLYYLFLLKYCFSMMSSSVSSIIYYRKSPKANGKRQNGLLMDQNIVQCFSFVEIFTKNKSKQTQPFHIAGYNYTFNIIQLNYTTDTDIKADMFTWIREIVMRKSCMECGLFFETLFIHGWCPFKNLEKIIEKRRLNEFLGFAFVFKFNNWS